MFTTAALTQSLECPHCQLNQFPSKNGQCRRCHHSLGVSYVEIDLPRLTTRHSRKSSANVRPLIGRLLRILRNKRCLTQDILSRYAQVSRSELSRFECGNTLPSLPALLRIASTLGIDHLVLRIRDTKDKL